MHDFRRNFPYAIVHRFLCIVHLLRFQLAATKAEGASNIFPINPQSEISYLTDRLARIAFAVGDQVL
jgi:hypothetical protein